MSDVERARGWFLGIGVCAADSDIAFFAAEFEKVRAEEREACARVLLQMARERRGMGDAPLLFMDGAAAVRARAGKSVPSCSTGNT